MEGEDGLDEAGDSGRRAPDPAEDPPGFEGGDGLSDQGPDLCVGSVDGLLTDREAVPPAALWVADRPACALLALAPPSR